MSSKSQQQQQHHQHHATTKLKPPPRLLFSCAMFRNCTQTVLSPTGTTTAGPPLPNSSSTGGAAVDTPPGTVPPRSPPPPASPPPPPSPPPIQQPPPHPSPTPKFVPLRPTEADPPPASSSSSSSSSSASHSFTLWRFPLHHTHSDSQYLNPSATDPPDAAYHKSCNSKNPSRDLEEAFKAADRYFACGSCLPALRLLERSLAAHDPAAAPCPREVMAGVVASVLDPSTARPAAKVLLALLLAEDNRRPAVEAGAAAAALSAVANAASGASGTAAAERALAALELMCTVPEGAVEVRVRPEAATVLAGAAGRMSGRGRECGLGVLASLYGGEWAADAPEEVGRAVVAAMQGECSARGRRKGAQLLKALQEAGRLAGVVEDGC